MRGLCTPRTPVATGGLRQRRFDSAHPVVLIMLSVVFTLVSAPLTHVGVRYAQSHRRTLLLIAALALLGAGFAVSTIPGGFWSSVYTLLSVYFLACLITPWLDIAWSSRRAG